MSIDVELRAQMRAVTAGDTPPPDLLQRVHAGVRRTRSRRIAAVGGVAVAASVAGLSLVVGGATSSPGRDVARVAGPAETSPADGPGPNDAELRAADWFSYESQPQQPDVQRQRERRWQHRDGRHLLAYDQGAPELINAESVFPFGRSGVSWDELLALPADPAELDRRMREAQGGRPDVERVLDQVKQLLGRSPAPSELRRALVDAALLHDGVTLDEAAIDSQGRPALLLRHTDRDGAVLQLFLDPAGYRLLEERTVAGPDFPTPPTDAPAPPDDEPAYAEGDLLYAEVFLTWGTAGPPV